MSVVNSIRSQLAPISPEGYPFIGAFALASLVLFWLWTPLGWLGTLLTLWCAYFFRDPPRVTPLSDRLVVSPADGRVSFVANAVTPTKIAVSPATLPCVTVLQSIIHYHLTLTQMSTGILSHHY